MLNGETLPELGEQMYSPINGFKCAVPQKFP